MQDAEQIKKIELVTLIVAGVYTFLGVLLLVFPTQLSSLFGYAVGAVAIAFGIYRFVLYLMRNRAAQLLAIDLYTGIILLAVGGLCLMKHQAVLEYVSMIFAIFLIAGGLIKVQNAFDLKQLDMYRWWIVLILGCISLCGAALTLLKPGFLAKIQLLATGIILLYDGISGLVTVLLFQVMQKKAGIKIRPQDGRAAPKREKKIDLKKIFQTVVQNAASEPETKPLSTPDSLEEASLKDDDASDRDELIEEPETEDEDGYNFDPMTGEPLR